MNNSEEKKYFSLVDGLQAGDLEDILKDCIEDTKLEVPNQVTESIRQKTFAKLKFNLHPGRSVGTHKIWGTLVASFLAIAVLTAVVGPDTVWATLQRALHYVPGMNLVIEDNERATERYILRKPIEKEVGGGTLKVKGVVIDENNALVQLSAEDLPVMGREYIYFKNARGQRFNIDSHSVGSTTGEWEGAFAYRGKIDDINGLELVLTGKIELSLPLPLEKAKRYASYAELGPTAVTDEISITAITSREKDMLFVNLVSPPLEGQRIEAYGMNPFSAEVEIKLKNDEGKEYPVIRDSSFMGPNSELSFKIGEAEKDLTLIIPHLSLINYDEAVVTIWLPDNGEATIDKTVELGGLPVTFKRINRLSPDRIQIEVDTNYNQKAPESLHNFRLADRSYSGQLDQSTGAIKTLEFEVNPYQLWVKLKIMDPVIIKNGPWEMTITE